MLAIFGVEEEQPRVDRGVGSSCEPVQFGWTYLGGVGSICGAGPTWLGLPQRGLGETGKSPITTVKHHCVFVVCSIVFYFLQFTFIELNCFFISLIAVFQ